MTPTRIDDNTYKQTAKYTTCHDDVKLKLDLYDKSNLQIN